MKKEPLGLYILRFVVNIGLFIFLVMLYWSYTLIEHDLRAIRNEINQLKSELLSLKDRPQTESSQNPAPSQAQNTLSSRVHIDPSLPNLLQEDPFYATTLPKLLGPDFKRSGTFHGAVLGKPDNLHPFSNWAQVSAWLGQCTVSVARQKFGIYETLSPDMALKMEERKNKNTGKTEFWIHLRDGVYWQPLRNDWFSEDLHLAPHFFKKHQVTAADFKFYLDAILNPYVQETGAIALRNYFEDIENVEVIDNLTFIVRWKGIEVKDSNGDVQHKLKYVTKLLTGGLRPLASFVYQYFPDGKKIVSDDASADTYRTNSVWAQNFAHHWAKNIIVGCGPWIFDGMSDRQIKFRRNPDHYFPYDVLANASEVQLKDSLDAMWQEFKSNRLDTYQIRPDQFLELQEFLKSPAYLAQKASGAAIHQLEYLARSYAYIGWNEAKPYFKSKTVRQALTMAIDRRRIIEQNLNGLGIEITGPFFYNSNSYDSAIAPWPFDPQKARRLLEAEGWYDQDGDGILDKFIDGKWVPFRFRLTYYVKNPTGKAICEYIATALKEIGIDCLLQGVDIADLTAVFEEKSFDAINLAWQLGTPPENPKQLWYSTGAKEKGSSNSIGFANAEIDKIIDALDYESDPEKRTALYHRFDAIIHEEAPYTFLYTPKAVLLYRDYVQNMFIPSERQDLIPGANVSEPDSSILWLRTGSM